MRTAGLLALLLTASLLCAQEAPSAPPPPTAAAEPAPPAPPPEAAPAPQAAPQLGHPLDPADVDILTGHSGNQRQTAYQAGYGYYYPYAGSVPLYGNGRFSGSNWGTGMFGPIGFGRGNLFLFHNHGFFPPLFGGNMGFGSHHGGFGHHH